MDTEQVVAALGALAHEHRLNICRLLIQAGPRGLNAGSIAGRLQLPPSSLTFHLQQLHRARLVTQERSSRQLIYAANYAMMNRLVGFLTENCCGESGPGSEGGGDPPARVRKMPPRKAADAG